MLLVVEEEQYLEVLVDLVEAVMVEMFQYQVLLVQ
jgi:hypothetical protein